MSKTGKRPLDEVLPVAQHIAGVLGEHCTRIEIAGSLRRQRPMVGDIEIVALPRRAVNLLGEEEVALPSALDTFLRGRVKLEKDGPLQKSFWYGSFKVDLFLPASPAHWGCVYLLRTGSHDFNMWLMSHRSGQAGVRFHDGRLMRRFGSELLDTPEEADVFAALNMAFVPPQQRDDGGWFAYLKDSTQARKEDEK